MAVEKISLSKTLLFTEGLGVYESKDVTDAQRVQLLCFYDVLTRISEEAEIVNLNQLDVNDRLDWDEEKYRLEINAV